MRDLLCSWGRSMAVISFLFCLCYELLQRHKSSIILTFPQCGCCSTVLATLIRKQWQSRTEYSTGRVCCGQWEQNEKRRRFAVDILELEATGFKSSSGTRGGWRTVVLVLGIYFKENKHMLTKWRFVFLICTYSNQVQNGPFRWTPGSGRNPVLKNKVAVIKKYT